MIGKVGRDSGLQGALGARQTQINRSSAAANASSIITSASGVAYKADQMTNIIEDFAKSGQNSFGSAVLGSDTAHTLMMSSKFAADILIQSSLMEAPDLPSAYFPPLLYCTEYDQVFGENATTNSTVVFSFRDIGNLFVEDESQPRSIPIQQVPDADEDNVQDMGRTSGYIKISGRVFGQAGLSRFNMLRDLCHYKGKEGLVFIDKNIGKFRVYPANIPGYTSSAEFFNQYAFQITLIIVGDTNKKKLSHKIIGEATKYALATANSGMALRAELYRKLDAFKRTMDQSITIEKKDNLKNLLVQYNTVNDDKIEKILNILEYGISGETVQVVKTPEYPTFTITEATPTIKYVNIVPSGHMSNGYTDGTNNVFWIPKYEPGEEFALYYKRLYVRLNEEEVLATDATGEFADRGHFIVGATWKKLVDTTDFIIEESVLRDNYPGFWTKITFNTAPEKWGIVKSTFVLPKTTQIEFHLATTDPDEDLLYIDNVDGSYSESLIQDNLVPYPISGSSLSVIETAGVTKLYVPELLNDPLLLSKVVVKKRVGDLMVNLENFTVNPSTTWENGRSGKWGLIELSTALNIGDFVSVEVILAQDTIIYANEHPTYTIKDSLGNNITFKWLSRPKITYVGNTVQNLVLSPNQADNGLYNSNFLTGSDTVYWVKGGISDEDPIIIRISDGNSNMIDMSNSDYTITYSTSHPIENGVWGKIEFNVAPTIDRILTINCRLLNEINTYRVTFKNSNILVSGNEVDLLFMEDVSDIYENNTYKNIYPIPEGISTGINGVIGIAGVTIVWIPKIIVTLDDNISELYPLNVKVNHTTVTNYILDKNVEKVVGSSEYWTKITFDQALSLGSVVEVDFTAEQEQIIYKQRYLEEVSSVVYTDECKPMKNNINTYLYYTPLCIDTSKPVEVKIDNIIVPESKYQLYKAVNRTYENKDGAILSQEVGAIKFLYIPGDKVDINVRYNRCETPTEEDVKLSIYLAEDEDLFLEIKDYYQRKNLKPNELKLSYTNGILYDFTKYEYFWPYPDGTKYITYKNSNNTQEFVFRPYDGIGQTYTATINKYSFSDEGYSPDLSDGNQNTAFSIDLSVPREGQDDWISRYNELVSRYPDANQQQEREIASMLLGKLVDHADFSDDKYISDNDVENAKLWLQVYNSSVENEDIVTIINMLNERTKLLELGVDGTPKEWDAINIVTIPNEPIQPVDLPPIEGWIFKETISTMKYTKEYVDVILYNMYDKPVINLKTKYITALDNGLLIYILRNDDTRLYYDNSYLKRIRIECGSKVEEYQFNTGEELINAIKNGQTVTVSGNGTVDFNASELITNPELFEDMEQETVKFLNKTNFSKEIFEIDKNTYEIFLLAIYGDIDAIYRSNSLPYYKYRKFRDVLGCEEASITLEEGSRNYYRFNKIVPII
jgi:hypothetical protein